MLRAGRGRSGRGARDARPNLFTNPQFANTGGAAPTSWAQVFATGVSAPAALADGTIAYEQSAAAERPCFFQTVALLANSVYTFSVIVDAVSITSGTANVIGTASMPAGATVSTPAAPSVGRNTITVTTTGTAGNCGFRLGLGVASTVTGTLRFHSPRLVLGS